ncbi:MAG: SUMF1/EgtB/PvdO family nonheme iron enzyme [Chloroflexota bacterium]
MNTDRVVISRPIELELIRIPAGEFWMGSDKSQDESAGDEECPPHRVELGEFYIARTLITNRQYDVFARLIQKKFDVPTGKGDHPAVNVSWRHAVWFCNWLSERTEKNFCLPSEAQWEKAARGDDGRVYVWGDEWDGRKANTMDGGARMTTRVGMYSPQGDSVFGVTDMLGNVWEWTSSVWGKDSTQAKFKYPYGADDGREDLNWGDEYLRVIRGGAFNYDKTFARCAMRYRDAPYNWYWNLGFRVVMKSGD